MAERERPMPEVNPLMFFGSWCGPGWSAGRRSDKPLTKEDREVGGKYMPGPNGGSRQSPVDLTCKAHDERYDAAYLTEDRLRRARMIQAADLVLLSDIQRLHASVAAGRLELSKDEIYFSNKMFVVFSGKLITNGRTIATLRTERSVGVEAINALRVAYPPSMIVLGLPSLPKRDGAPRRAPPAHHPKPTIIRIDSDLALATALSNLGRPEPVNYLKPRQLDY